MFLSEQINPTAFLIRLFPVIFMLIIVQSGLAQDLTLQQARDMSMAGDYKEAKKVFGQLLAADPDNLEYMLHNAYNSSWAGDYEIAEQGFNQVLMADPVHQLALIGAGYNDAWAKNYAQARQYFNRLKAIGHETEEVQKGLAYTYLWEGEYKVAILYFKRLTNDHPDNPEYHLALGQSFERQNLNNQARNQFLKTIELDGSVESASVMLKQLDYKAAFLEVDIWGGVNVFDTLTKIGFRNAQIGIQLSRKARGFIKYDNSFSLENKNFAVLQKSVPSISFGLLAGWNKHTTTYIENGMRFFKEEGKEYFFSGEQVYFVSNQLLIKAGGLYGVFEDNSSEWMLFGGFSFPIGKVMTIEPVYFHTRPRYSGSGHENRFLIKAQFKSTEGYELTFGAMAGKAGQVAEGLDQNIYSGFLYGVLPFSRRLWAQFSINREWGIYDSFTSINAGLKIRIDR